MDEMARHPIDERTADRLMSGGLAPDDAPPGYEPVARLVRAVQAPASPAELGGEKLIASVAAAAVASAAEAPLVGPRRGSNKVISKLGTVRAAAITAAAVLGAGAAAAAATGSLPSQTHGSSSPTALTASNSAPGANGGGTTQSNPNLNNSNPLGLPTTGAANFHAVIGLCRAFLAHNSAASPSSTTGGATAPPEDSSSAFQALRKDATGSDTGSLTATVSWCTTYLAKYSPGQSGTAPTGNASARNGNPPSGNPSSPGNSGSRPGDGGGSPHGNSSSTGAGQPGRH